MISSILCSCLLDLDGQTHTHISVYMHVPANACMVYSTASHVRALPPACWPAWADTHTSVHMHVPANVCMVKSTASHVLCSASYLLPAWADTHIIDNLIHCTNAQFNTCGGVPRACSASIKRRTRSHKRKHAHPRTYPHTHTRATPTILVNAAVGGK